MSRVSRVADPPVIVVLSILLAGDGVPGPVPAGRRAFLILVISHLFVQIVKRLASRPRPGLAVGVESVVRAGWAG